MSKIKKTDKIVVMCMESLEDLFLQKESAFYEKRVVCRYLGTLLSQENYTPIGYPDLVNKYKDQQALNSIYIQTIGSFIKKFSLLRQGNYFKLVNIVHFLYEQKYIRFDVEQTMKFIQKAKQIYNVSQNKEKSTQMDGDRLLPFELISNDFNISSNKDKTNFDLVKELLDQIKIDTVEGVQKIMEYILLVIIFIGIFQIQMIKYKIYLISQLLCFIEILNLFTKQNQLEVLLCFIHKIQGNQIEEKTAIMTQKHSKVLSDLLNQFEQTVEESKLKREKIQKQSTNQYKMTNVKQVLYDDDLRDEKILQSEIANPYKLQTK